MAYQSSKHAGLSPITKRHKAGLILLCRRLRRNQTAQLQVMIETACAAQRINIKALTSEQIESTLKS
jgi:hypothetical protein